MVGDELGTGGGPAELTDAELTDAELTDTELTDTRLTDTRLTDTRLTDTRLTDTRLTDTRLTDTRLTDTRLTDAGLTDAGLTDAGLTDAGLTDAGLTDAGLTDAGLTDAGLTDAGLTDAELTNAWLTSGLRAGYDAAADDWAEGPGLMYAQLARVLVAAAPVPLAGCLVLDLGAGVGVAGRAALAAGARRVVAVDLSEGMLRHGGGGRPVAADAVALPFRDASFDLVVAAFCLNHLGSLAAGLTEARRVGAAIAASMFAPGWTHPAKDAVDDAVRSFGYRPPGTRPFSPGRGPVT